LPQPTTPPLVPYANSKIPKRNFSDTLPFEDIAEGTAEWSSMLYADEQNVGRETAGT
jgi:hypothetical protein